MTFDRLTAIHIPGYYTAKGRNSRCLFLEASSIRDLQDLLNGTIKAAVTDVSRQTPVPTANRLHLVQTNLPGSPFEGRDSCSPIDSDINYIYIPPNDEYSLHPNSSGHQHYAQLAKESMM